MTSNTLHCHICQLVLVDSESTIKQHISSIHLNYRPYDCRTCNDENNIFKAATEEVIDAHIATSHSTTNSGYHAIKDQLKETELKAAIEECRHVSTLQLFSADTTADWLKNSALNSSADIDENVQVIRDSKELLRRAFISLAGTSIDTGNISTEMKQENAETAQSIALVSARPKLEQNYNAPSIVEILPKANPDLTHHLALPDSQPTLSLIVNQRFHRKEEPMKEQEITPNSDLCYYFRPVISMDRLICGICMEELGNERDVCSLPCGHVKHIDCLTEWCKERKNCPNCWQRFNSSAAFRKRLYFDREPNSDNNAPGANNEAVQDDSVLAINEVLKQQLEESKAEVDAAQMRVNDLEQSIRELERKHQDSEVQLQKSSEGNRSLINELNKLGNEIREKNLKNLEQLRNSHSNNRETLERNRELEQELSKSQAEIRDLKAKFDQTHVGQLIKFMAKETENLKNCEVSRLQDSLDAKNDEIARLQNLLDTQENEIGRLQNLLETRDNEIARLRDNEIAYLQDLLETQDSEIARLKHSLETKNIELTNERKLRLGIAERLGKKEKEAANLSDKNAKIKRDLCDMQKRLTASEKEKLDVIQYKAELETAVKQNNDIIKEIAQVKRELSDNQKRLETAVKQNNDTKKEKEKMKEQLAEWDRYHQKIIKVAKYGDEIGKEKQEPTNSQRLQQESPPLLVPIMPPTVLKRQNSISGLANGDPAKRFRIDTQKKSGEDDARK